GFPKHNPPPTAWRRECSQCSLCPDRHLSRAGRAAELLDAVGIHRRPRAPVPKIAAARAQRVRSLDPDITCVERKGVAAFDAVPLEGFQEELRNRRVAVVRIEYIDI